MHAILWLPIIVAAIAVLAVSFGGEQAKAPFPTCPASARASFHTQLGDYWEQGTCKAGPAKCAEVAGYRGLHGECAFSQDYHAARDLFLAAAAQIPQAKVTPYEVQAGLYIDVVEIPGDQQRVLMSTSGVHGPEGFAGSAIQTSMLSMVGQVPAMRAAYAGAAEAEAAAQLPPTLLFIHAVNPYGFANNRRFNEDNIDLNRNFLTDEKFAEVRARDPNFAGYMDIDFMINPQWMPFGTVLALNDMYGHLKSAYAVVKFGITNVKRALVAGNYFRQSGLGFGGFKRSRSAEIMIQIAAERELHKAKKIVLLDHHTGLGPSGTDTLALLGQNDIRFNELINQTFPLEMDGDRVVGGDKASDAAGSAMSGYEFTIGTTEHYCKTWMHPEGNHLKDVLCLTQEFGTVPVIQVGKAQIEENFAHHHGNAEQRRVYGERLKGVFYVETQEWMRNVAHRGVTLFMQAFQFIQKD